MNKKECDYCGDVNSHKYYNTDKGILCSKHYQQHNKGRLGTTKILESHGMFKSPEYTSWSHLKSRCLCKTDSKYPDYGGRGITVCDRWKNSFTAFYEDMGPKPSPLHSIDRENNDGNYEPTNCRWALPHIQQRNKRLYKTNKSGYKGVTWEKDSKKWKVFLNIDKKIITIGRFQDKEDAIKAREEAELKYYKQ